MDQTHISHSSPVTGQAQPSWNSLIRRLFSKIAKGEVPKRGRSAVSTKNKKIKKKRMDVSQISVDVSSNSESGQHDKILEHPTSCEEPIPFRTSTTTKKYKYRLFPNACSLEKTRVDVSSYIEFKRYLNHCATQKMGPVSFNVSDNVDSNDYKKILWDLIGSYKKSGRLDKIKHPRSNHLPLPVVTCATVKEMRDVYHAIGPYYRVIIKPDSSLPPKQKNKR